METGSMATQVSPGTTEPDMNVVRTVFDRAANAIVEASELAKVVSQLRIEVEQLRKEIEAVRSNNKWLDEQLTQVRKDRDEANNRVYELDRNLTETKAQLNSAAQTIDSHVATIEALKRELEGVTKDRDDAIMKGLEHETKARDAEERLAAFKKLAASTFGLTEPQPKPEPVPLHPVQAIEAHNEPVNEPTPWWDRPAKAY